MYGVDIILNFYNGKLETSIIENCTNWEKIDRVIKHTTKLVNSSDFNKDKFYIQFDVNTYIYVNILKDKKDYHCRDRHDFIGVEHFP